MNVKKDFSEEDVEPAQLISFYRNDEDIPEGWVQMPPPANQAQKETQFIMGFGLIRQFQTPRVFLASDVWISKMEQEEYEKWIAEGKSLAENPTSGQAVMIWGMDLEDKKYMQSVSEYKITDDGEVEWIDESEEDEFATSKPQEQDWDALQGTVPSIAKKAFDILYDKDFTPETEDVEKYFGQLSAYGLLVGMNERMFNKFGLE